MPDHIWRPCIFKNATFCMVCGKLMSQLGEVPLDAEKNVPSLGCSAETTFFRKNVYQHRKVSNNRI